MPAQPPTLTKHSSEDNGRHATATASPDKRQPTITQVKVVVIGTNPSQLADAAYKGGALRSLPPRSFIRSMSLPRRASASLRIIRSRAIHPPARLVATISFSTPSSIIAPSLTFQARQARPVPRAPYSTTSQQSGDPPVSSQAEDMSEPTGLIAKSGIELLTFGTPNGYKVSILLEELKEAYGKEYTWQSINIGKNTQKEPWFVAAGANGRIPYVFSSLL
ncbi:hypothetical protein NUW58_g10498 [Xylaria curta]|uniref:Uncharacterized protein n=1 Tax=Xylaria curta TaxID=42375 RepID=A0ACC1MJY9_9PEZI|nr:hypothetical protein NUW58_g10498 [Xylaria curta]